MASFKRFKKIPGVSAAASVASRGVTAVRSLPKAAGVFGTSLAEGIREDTEGRRQFGNAPLGQYYLPERVQSALRYVLPTPGGVASSYRKSVEEGGVRGVARAALTTADIATLPFLASGVARAPRAGVAASRVVSRGLARRGALVASEVGAAGGKRALARTPTAIAERAAKAKLAKEVAPAARKPGEFVISKTAGRITINDVDYAQVALGQAKVPGLTASIVRSEGFMQAFAQVNRGKALQMTFRAEVPQTVARTSKVATAEATMSRARATVASAAEKAAARPTTARPPLAQRLGASPPKPQVRKPGPVISRAATAAEKARMDDAAKVAKEIQTGARTVTGAPKPVVPKRTPGTMTAPAAKTAPKMAPRTSTAAAEVADEGPRGAIRAVLSAGTTKRGQYASIAKKYGISRQRIGQLVKSESKKMSKAAGEATATAPKPVVATAAKVTPKTAPVAKTATSAVEAVKVRKPRVATSVTQAASASGIVGRVINRLPKKTLLAGAVLAGGATVLSERGRAGVGTKPSATPTTNPDAWVDTLPDDLKKDVKGLMAVKAKYGEAGLEALREGLEHAELKYGESYFKDDIEGMSGIGKSLAEKERQERLRKAVKLQAKRLGLK